MTLELADGSCATDDWGAGSAERACGPALDGRPDAPISWPRVQPREHRGGNGLWVNDTLVRAIRTENAVALRYWFAASVTVAWRWRRAFGAGGHATTKGSTRAIRAAGLKGAVAIKAKVWTDDELDRKAETAKRIGLRPPDRWTGRGGWTAKELKLLGTDHDLVIAKRLGRTAGVVTVMRTRCKGPAFSGWPGGGPGWTAAELAMLGTDLDEVIAEKIGRTESAVRQKRLAVGIPVFRDRRSRGG